MKKIASVFLSAVLAVACTTEPTSESTASRTIEKTTKRNIGSKLTLYPVPLVVVGAWVDDRVNWITVGHTGIIGHDRILISMSKSHYTNAGIRKTKILSVNIVDEALLRKADYAGSVSGRDVDKSRLFDFHSGDIGAPVIDASPLVMECRIEEIYETEKFDNFICSVANTYADERVLDPAGKINYRELKPVLFEFPTYSYLRTGETIGRGLNLEKDTPLPCVKLPQTDKSIVRLSKVVVRPEYLEEYKAAAAEVGTISLRTEPGVLTMYAVAEKNNPCQITILETYADTAAYRSHIASAHFRKYKQGTLKMIRSLELIDTDPLNPAFRLQSVAK